MIHSVPSISTRYFYVESVLFLIHLSDSSSILFSHCYSHLQIMSTYYVSSVSIIHLFLPHSPMDFIWVRSFRYHIQLHTYTCTCPLISAQRWNNASFAFGRYSRPISFLLQYAIASQWKLFTFNNFRLDENFIRSISWLLSKLKMCSFANLSARYAGMFKEFFRTSTKAR